jgi:uncharacterized membrane protein YphA (DoxX/SURF4 family)
MMLLRIASRLLIAWVFLRNALDVLRNPGPRVTQASWLLEAAHSNVPLLPRDDVLLVKGNAAVQIASAALLALGVRPRLAALALVGSMVPTTLGGHAFWQHDDPTRRAQQQIHFDKNLAIIGGLLVAALESSRRRRV